MTYNHSESLPTEPETASTANQAKDEFEYICELDDLVLNKIVSAYVGGREVRIVRTVAGVYAIGARCPHQGADMCAGLIKGTMAPSERNEYQYVQEGEIVTCPWHGFEFDMRTGASVGGAIKGRLGAYQVRVQDGSVYCSPRRVRPQRPSRRR